MTNEPVYTAISFMFLNTPGHDVDSVMELLDDWIPCDHDEDSDESCYLVLMGGSSGTEEQCYKYLGTHESQALVQADDLKMILRTVFPSVFPVNDSAHWEENGEWSTPLELRQAYQRLRKEAYWHDEFENWLKELPEDGEEE